MKGGCYKGYCWSGCEALLGDVNGKEWCYTTKGSSQDHKYVSCSQDSDCGTNGNIFCDYCAGGCTI